MIALRYRHRVFYRAFHRGTSNAGALSPLPREESPLSAVGRGPDPTPRSRPSPAPAFSQVPRCAERRQVSLASAVRGMPAQAAIPPLGRCWRPIKIRASVARTASYDPPTFDVFTLALHPLHRWRLFGRCAPRASLRQVPAASKCAPPMTPATIPKETDLQEPRAGDRGSGTTPIPSTIERAVTAISAT